MRLLTMGLTIVITLAAAVPAIAAKKPLAPACQKVRELPAACYLIFSSEQGAAMSCPTGISPIKVYDFWQHKFLGWSCDCGPTDGDEISDDIGAEIGDG